MAWSGTACYLKKIPYQKNEAKLMASPSNQQRGRGLERIFILAIVIVMGLLFYQLFNVLKRDFDEVPLRVADGSMVNLNHDKPAERIAYLLQKGFYFEDPKDIQLIRSTIAKQTVPGEYIDNIGALNKQKYNVKAEEAYANGGVSFQRRVKLSRSLLGFTGPDSLRYEQEKTAPEALSSSLSLGLGKHKISGRLYNGEGASLNGVMVRLEMILPKDSTYSASVDEVDKRIVEYRNGVRKVFVLDSAGHRQLESLTAYTRTAGNGGFSFEALPDDKAFSVLPLQPGYQFGPSKGVQKLDENTSFNFYQSVHSLKLLSTKDYNNLRKEKALIVREPAEFIKWYWVIAACFLGGFILIHILLSIRLPQTDQLIIPVVMALTGISLLTLLSLQDPLRDRFLSRSTLGYFIAGLTGLIILLLFNFRKFTTDSGLYRMFLRKYQPAKGWQWAVAATGLLILTILLGTGPEGSGVKVNLFGFQPSEIVKFLIILFLAGFFATNERFISEYRSWKKRWYFFSFAVIAILASIILFLMLGDLGPAIVVCFTFIILFSFSRGDFILMAGAVVLYVLCGWVLKNIWLATGVTILILVLVMLFSRKQISESSIMALIVIAGFLLLDQVPFIDEVFPGPVQRLVDRKAIWENAWDNEVFGGDHVANGIWAMSSGGLTGQGIGEGFAKTIPEAHTDMILPSLGEEFGLAGIICIFILFLVYLHRSILIGRQTGTPFLFYLCAGIGVGTFVQFLLIAGGSIGALPLSGVSLPFVSYGGSSLIINLLAAGFLLSASFVRGSAVQMQFITKQQDRNLVPALVAACIGLLLLTSNVGRYLFNNEKWVVEPALVADRSGARMFSYNPRIAILINKLEAGDLYDRKGMLLATSKKEHLAKQRDSLIATGLEKYKLDSISHKRQDRFYPYGEHMFFWTGDINTGLFMGSTNGYFAEYELLAELRGFDAPSVNYHVKASRFREDRFLPETAVEMSIVKSNYGALAPLLLAGINSVEVENFKKQNRNVQLSMDASLQTFLNQSLQKDDSLLNKRVSVVIMEDSGDVLASSAYPLPQINDWEQMMLTPAEQNSLAGWITNKDLGFTHATQPGSTAKILTAMAALNKLGPGITTKVINIKQQDLIRTKGLEPDEPGNITMERAIVKSNNSYFIKLANEMQLQEEMGNLYIQTGMFLRGVGGYYYSGDLGNEVQQNKWRDLWRRTEFRSIRSYNPNDIRRTRGRGVSGMAWGQGELISTPASVARMVSAVANKGIMPANRYVLKISDSLQPLKPGVAIARDSVYGDILKEFMIKQSFNKTATLGISVAGKTGTPERIVKGRRINDGWYVFFAPKKNGKGNIVVCIRIEDTKGSSDAIKLAAKHVVPRLLQQGYIKGFGEEARPALD
jgi:cell division protein FtsW (lipid II flippase)